MSDQQLNELFIKYFSDTASDNDKDALKEKLASASDRDLELLLEARWKDHNAVNLPVPDNQLMLETILSTGNREEEKVRSIPGWRRYAVAAAVLIFIAGGWWVYNNYNGRSAGENKMAAVKAPNDILPGSDKAVLTLADGSSILLDSAGIGSLAQQGGTRIIKLNNGQLAYEAGNSNVKPGASASPVGYNTIVTPHGGQYQIVLPDGSRVWLNAGSYLRFPTSFSGSERMVEMKGEAYFEIAKNKSQSFIVKVNTSKVEVLGTDFNVMAYSDEASIKTTLLQGSVKVSEGGSEVLIKPGQQAVIDRSGSGIKKLNLNNRSLEQAIAWKNNEFYFDDDTIESIMRQLGRWYDIKVVYEGTDKSQRFSGVISRKEDVSVLLEKFEQTGTIKFRIENKTIYVK